MDSSSTAEGDREIASRAVSIVISGARKGAVHLCSSVAELLKENRRLQRIVEAQQAQIQLLRNMPSAARSISAQASTSSSCSTPSLSVMQDAGFSSSCSSGRGSLSPSVPLSGLPPLTVPHREILTDHGKAAAVFPLVQWNEQESAVLQVPLMDLRATIPRRRPHPSSPRLRSREMKAQSNEVREFEKKPQEELSLGEDTLHKKHKEKTTRSVQKEDSRLVKELDDLGLKQRCPPTESDSSICHGTDTAVSRHQCHTRAKHRLKLNDRVVLDTKQKGMVRFIGHLENMSNSEVFIGLELDTACGENDGMFNGTRYFRCKANCGTFTTMSHIKKLSKPGSSQVSQSRPAERMDSSDSDGVGSSARRSKSRLRRTAKQMNVTAQVHRVANSRARSAKSSGSS
ncbi:uncharacterized protein LOC125711598 isoform X2 [Brienomyrus brachyistius]|uniref:uncharacterized protein LOC125711598 isoform X2 n=1 Tax=Brienomyrus brachyistius TaxID=42636 RepID=UPI0020B38EE7|nr:uncharacterized protein LOC125711598 isoform X2 [Brienomyrus brachyistius]